MEFRNGILLQLIECIESTQNEVKRKMIKADACQRCTKVTSATRTPKKVRAKSQFTLTRALVILIYEMIRLDAQCGLRLFARAGENAVAMAGEH